MENKKINEKELENVNGGLGAINVSINGNYSPAGKIEIPVGKYTSGQKIKFRNPRNAEEILEGTISTPFCYEDGEVLYLVEEIPADPTIVSNIFTIKESNILGTI